MSEWVGPPRPFKMAVRKRVVVTGLGLCTPLGTGVQKVWQKLLNCHSGIVNLPETEEYANLPSKVAGIVPVGKDDFLESDWVTASERRTMSLASVYALCVTAQALRDACLDVPFKSGTSISNNTGVSIGSCMPDLQEIITSGNLVAAGKHRRVSPYFVPKILPNLPAGHVSMRYNLAGPNHAPSTACATGLHAIGDASTWISRGLCDIMVAGGTESCVHPLAITGFCRAKALSTKFNSFPAEASRPFDSKRDGFVFGEGAGVVVLEELEHALKRNCKIYAEVLGYGSSADAHHITAPMENGEGAARSMMSALKDAHLSPTAIGHVNAHATSTPLGDAAENAAIKSVFGRHSKELLISATKGSTGHLLAAAGSVETVFTVLAVSEGVAPPTINLEEKEDEFDLNYCESGPVDWTMADSKRRVALTNSFGFGGTNGTLCIGQYT